MRPAALRRLLRRPDVSALLVGVADGAPLSVLAPDGAVLWGTVAASGEDGTDDAFSEVFVAVGAVAQVRGRWAAAGAAALGAVLALERERRVLADEVLGLYREINLLYTLAERLSSAPDRAELARRALAEATRIVEAQSGAVVVSGTVDRGRGARGRSSTAAAFGAPLEAPDEVRAVCTTGGPHGALLVAPLLDGALLLGRADPFTAADLKLAVAVAASAASVLTRILGEEERSAAAAARERQLRAQVEQLRVELDESRRDEQVRQITDSDYFAGLRSQAQSLRRIVDEPGAADR